MGGDAIMKYYRKTNGVVYAFESDGSQDHLITKDLVQMKDDEVDKHINPDKYLTASERYAQYIKALPTLDRRQFKLGLLNKGVLHELEGALEAITDDVQKATLTIVYTESTAFKRTSEPVKQLLALVAIQEQDINDMWETASKL